MLRFGANYGLTLYVFLSYLAADFPNHDNPLGFWVVGKPLQAVDEVGAIKRISTDTHAGALTHACEVNIGGSLGGHREREVRA